MNDQPLSALLKTFPHTRYYPEWRLLTWHPRGLFDDALADKLIGVIGLEERVEEVPFHRYADFSGLTRARFRCRETSPRRARTSEVCILLGYDCWAWHRPDVRSADGGSDNSGARVPRACRSGGMARCAIGNSPVRPTINRSYEAYGNFVEIHICC